MNLEEENCFIRHGVPVVTCKTKKLKCGGAGRWRVSYQLGLPRLVLDFYHNYGVIFSYHQYMFTNFTQQCLECLFFRINYHIDQVSHVTYVKKKNVQGKLY